MKIADGLETNESSDKQKMRGLLREAYIRGIQKGITIVMMYPNENMDFFNKKIESILLEEKIKGEISNAT